VAGAVDMAPRRKLLPGASIGNRLPGLGAVARRLLDGRAFLRVVRCSSAFPAS
jgi:hypothetical protein